MRVSCIFMFSGGLDSVVGAHLLAQQGVDVHAVHFVLPFDSGLGFEHTAIGRSAASAGVPLTVVEEGPEFVAMLKAPAFGFGKHANPCIDCRIHRLTAAKRLMEERGAAFVATGEVVGQRPMSQRMDALRRVEKRAGLRGQLLRPLSAQLMPPTQVEADGLVDRQRLLGISGRGRTEQLAYARRYGLEHGAPAGGCILTNEKTAGRFEDLCRYAPEWGFEDLRLIAWGRRFRIADTLVLLVGRNASENAVLEKLARPEDHTFQLTGDVPGPFAFARGCATAEQVSQCASIVARYANRAPNPAHVAVEVRCGEEVGMLTVARADNAVCESVRV